MVVFAGGDLPVLTSMHLTGHIGLISSTVKMRKQLFQLNSPRPLVVFDAYGMSPQAWASHQQIFW